MEKFDMKIVTILTVCIVLWLPLFSLVVVVEVEVVVGASVPPSVHQLQNVEQIDLNQLQSAHPFAPALAIFIAFCCSAVAALVACVPPQ